MKRLVPRPIIVLAVVAGVILFAFDRAVAGSIVLLATAGAASLNSAAHAIDRRRHPS